MNESIYGFVSSLEPQVPKPETIPSIIVCTRVPRLPAFSTMCFGILSMPENGDRTSVTRVYPECGKEFD
jgi:hypothetical protein